MADQAAALLQACRPAHCSLLGRPCTAAVRAPCRCLFRLLFRRLLASTHNACTLVLLSHLTTPLPAQLCPQQRRCMLTPSSSAGVAMRAAPWKCPLWETVNTKNTGSPASSGQVTAGWVGGYVWWNAEEGGGGVDGRKQVAGREGWQGRRGREQEPPCRYAASGVRASRQPDLRRRSPQTHAALRMPAQPEPPLPVAARHAVLHTPAAAHPPSLGTHRCRTRRSADQPGLATPATCCAARCAPSAEAQSSA